MKTNTKWVETLRFLIAGVVCFVLEFICLVLLRDTCGLDTLLAAPIAFLISVTANYLLCAYWVFSGAKEQSVASKAGFLITSLIGLLLNELFMLLLRWLLGEDAVLLTVFGFHFTMYMLNKAISTLLVMIWNFFTKRTILRHGLSFLKKR